MGSLAHSYPLRETMMNPEMMLANISRGILTLLRVSIARCKGS